MKRISRGTPYILTSDDIANTLACLPPGVEESVARLLNMTTEEWREQGDRVRVKQLVDYQNAGMFAATFSNAARAIGDLQEAASPVLPASERDDLKAALELLTEQVNRHDDILGRTAKKGA